MNFLRRRWTPLVALGAVLCSRLWAAEPPPPSTAFTRGLLRSPDLPTAQSYLGIVAASNAVMTVTNGQAIRKLPPPSALSLQSSWDLLECILTNSATETIIYEGSVFPIGHKVELIYGAWTNGFGTPNRGDIRAAIGSSIGNLVKIGAIISPGAAGTWDSAYVSPGRVYWENGTNFLTYFGGTNAAGFEVAPSSIGLAYSVNGTNWTKYSGNPILSPAQSFDASACYVASVIKVGNTYFWYWNGGSSGPTEKVGMGFSTSIFGPITRYSGNPIVSESTGLAFTFFADPQIVALNQGGWVMLGRSIRAGPFSTPAVAYSRDLTNWFAGNVDNEFEVPWRSFNPLVTPSTHHLYGGGYFEDHGPAMLMDDLTNIFVMRPTRQDLIAPERLGSGTASASTYLAGDSTFKPFANGFPLAITTVLLTNPVASQAITLIQNWNGSTIFNALGFNFQSTANEFYMDTNGMAFNTHGGADFRFDQGLLVLGTINGNGAGITNLPTPDTIAWASGSLTLGWPTLFHTHSITSNSWITGFAGGVAGKTLTAFLTVTNATASDFTLSVSNSVTSTDGLRSWTVTNKTSRGFSFKAGAQTNASSAPFF